MKMKKQLIFLSLMTVSALAIIVQGYQEEKRLSSLERSFSELFNDRLIAESCVFKMNDLLHKKRALQLTATRGSVYTNNTSRQEPLSRALSAIYSEFRKTKLSAAEQVISQKIAENITRMGNLETLAAPDEKKINELRQTYANLNNLLGDLSDIQIYEGTKLNNDSRKTLATAFIGLKLDAAVYLLFLGSLFGLLRNTLLMPKFPVRHELN